MDIVSRVIIAIDTYKRMGLKPDVLVLGTTEAEELRLICENYLGYECKDINGWEHQGLKVVKVNDENYLGLAVDCEELCHNSSKNPFNGFYQSKKLREFYSKAKLFNKSDFE